MGTAVADLTIVWSYSDTGADAVESCVWYAPDSISHLHFSMRDFIERQLDIFYMMFSEWFNVAEYPDVEEQLYPQEVIVFRGAAGAADTKACDIDGCDCFAGLRAVVRHRLDQKSLEQTKLAAELFNWVMDFGLDLSGETASAVIKVESLETFAPFLLARIIDRLSDDLKRQADYEVPVGSFDRKFVPLAPLLEILKEAVGNGDWIENELAADLVLWIFGLYRSEIEAEEG